MHARGRQAVAVACAARGPLLRKRVQTRFLAMQQSGDSGQTTTKSGLPGAGAASFTRWQVVARAIELSLFDNPNHQHCFRRFTQYLNANTSSRKVSGCRGVEQARQAGSGEQPKQRRTVADVHPTQCQLCSWPGAIQHLPRYRLYSPAFQPLCPPRA